MDERKFNFSEKEDGTFYALAGTTIDQAIDEAFWRSNNAYMVDNRAPQITFEFNGVVVNIRGDISEPILIRRDWLRALHGYIDKKVGPYCSPELTEEEKANDAMIEAQNEERRQQAQAEYNAKMNAKREYVEKILADAQGIELINPEEYQDWKDKQTDEQGYGLAIFRFAETWSRLMQVEITKGEKIEDIAQRTSHEANFEGITGFMYGAAVSILSKCWKYGEELRIWHNLDTQIDDEGEKANKSGGVLNPALLIIR